jgi:hypothetical protein
VQTNPSEEEEQQRWEATPNRDPRNACFWLYERQDDGRANKKSVHFTVVLCSTAYRIRTGVTAVRGRRPRPLDECGTKCPSRRREV